MNKCSKILRLCEKKIQMKENWMYSIFFSIFRSIFKKYQKSSKTIDKFKTENIIILTKGYLQYFWIITCFKIWRNYAHKKLDMKEKENWANVTQFPIFWSILKEWNFGLENFKTTPEYRSKNNENQELQGCL